MIVLLLITGQTIIFLLRLVAADRRGRRRPLASATKTVGELEDAATAEGEDPSAAADGDGRGAEEGWRGDPGPDGATPRLPPPRTAPCRPRDLP